VSEAEPASPDNVYGVSKRYVEIVGGHYRQQDKLEFIALRISIVVGAGATSTASRWRSDIFEKLQASQHTRINLPYGSDELLPLIHVLDVAHVIRRLVEAKRTLHTIYNTPSDNWRCGDLADYIRSLNPNVELVLDPSNNRGDPEAINGNRLVEELGHTPIPVGERLRWSRERRVC
jgi:nucleoside-diphosphate-sugar epimerase